MRDVKLTASELSHLWVAYMNSSMAERILEYFVHTSDDQDIKKVTQAAMEESVKTTTQIKRILDVEGIPVPHGFTKDEADPQAPKLFTDRLIIEYVKQMASLGLAVYGVAMSLCPREDVRHLFKDRIESSANLLEQTVSTLLNKGIYVRPPYIPYPDSTQFVHKESFMSGMFGDRRPLNSIEITNLFQSTLTNSLGKAKRS
ncbi:DUF3231 family protein [Brevibacillus dissolubilis]|uniref:DUF3231 family protein n=1 Tax=Brevibacillus dissolubilis TaxID=1844116 RepID=UPI0011176D1A|nr:DUF3231 family protein [Brevibacillus dissolubilis]